MKFAQYQIPGLVERPDWWQVRPAEITSIASNVSKGKHQIIATTPNGHPISAVYYGDFPPPPQVNNWSSATCSTKPETYNTRHDQQQTIVFCAGIHGAEAEGVAAAVNLISLLETGVDLRGNERPKLMQLMSNYRFIIIPCANMDGRAISPDHLQGASFEDFRKASQGYWPDGSLIGWPGCKEWFPLPLDKVAYPGGYPNGEGFNIMHDACPGNLRTAEATAILKLTEAEQVDLFLNVHSCISEPFICEPSAMNFPANIANAYRLRDLADAAWIQAGLRQKPVTRSKHVRNGVNLNNAITLNCGALAITFESTICNDCSFTDLLEMEYVLLEALLEDGLTNRFADRDAIVNTCRENS